MQIRNLMRSPVVTVDPTSAGADDALRSVLPDAPDQLAPSAGVLAALVWSLDNPACSARLPSRRGHSGAGPAQESRLVGGSGRDGRSLCVR
jgi:hypothetical protein